MVDETKKDRIFSMYSANKNNQMELENQFWIVLHQLKDHDEKKSETQDFSRFEK